MGGQLKKPIQAADVARLLSIYLPSEDVVAVDRETAETGKAASAIDLNLKLFLRLTKFHPQFRELVKQLTREEIAREEFETKKVQLGYKFVGEYNLALRILSQALPLDMDLFHQIISNDQERQTLFESFAAGRMDYDEYMAQDQARLAQIQSGYEAEIIRRREADEVINDYAPQLV